VFLETVEVDGNILPRFEYLGRILIQFKIAKTVFLQEIKLTRNPPKHLLRLTLPV
jgi:hypothetical protein